MNRCFLTGRIGQEPKSTVSNDGRTTIVRFSIAADNPFSDNVVWLNVVTFNEIGKYVFKEGKKGTEIYIDGYINSYSREVNGKKYTNVEVVGNKVQLILPEKSNIGSDFGGEKEARAEEETQSGGII